VIYFVDIEANGLLDSATTIHCLSYKALNQEPVTLTKNFHEFLGGLWNTNDTLVWHNGFGYDIPLLEKFGIIVPEGVQIIDTLAMSREWWPDNPTGHSLEAWAKKLGTYKVEVDDWNNQPIEVYIDRCVNDVITTEKVFMFLCDKLGIEYD